jgi:hypothetical protein
MDTFVVRVFRNEDSATIQGVVSRVATGDSVTFQSVGELVAFLADPGGGPGIGEEPML